MYSLTDIHVCHDVSYNALLNTVSFVPVTARPLSQILNRIDVLCSTVVICNNPKEDE
jgi:hypothetical protein